jgi:putative transposase
MGQYEFTTSPMGLLGCPASFQRLMEMVTKDLPNVIVYIDDILVHSKTHRQHQQILSQLFQRLSQHNLKIRLEKCHFATTEVEYLGFKLTPKGVLPGTDKTKAIKDATPPSTVHQVRQFLGLCNFFRQHIKQFALRSHPLTVLTRKDCPWKGGPLPPDALKAFNELKSCLTSQPIVSFPKKNLQYALITDAATGDDNHPGGMGAILTQVDKDGKFYVIAYASKKIEKHEKNYTPFLLEMYAAVWGMEHFSHHLRGKRFLLFTDHKPLEKLGKVHTKTLYRIQEAMLNYDFEIHYRKGDDMPADYLSRNILAINDDIDHICQQQKEDPQLSNIINYLKTGQIPNNKEGKILISKYASRCYLEDDLLYIRFFDPVIGHRSLVCIPKTLITPLCAKYHQSWYGGHEGIIKMKQRLLNRYFWPNMEKDLQKEIENCHQCQTRRKDDTAKAHLRPLPIPSEPNQRIHADLFGPLKTSEKGKKFILVITDAFTKYVELVATENKEADTIANHIFNNWICRFGIPVELVTDQGKEFTAQVCSRLWSKLEMIHSTTTARHPQTNAQAEVVNKTIARYLSAFVDESTLDWEAYLPALMFSYNTSFHRAIKTSPFFLTYGMQPNIPKDFNIDYKVDTATDVMSKLQLARYLANKHIENAQSSAKQHYDQNVKKQHFYKNQPVLLDEHYYLNRNQKIAPKFTGPHLITQLKGDTNVELLLNNGKTTIVHVNRIKPYISRENLPQEILKPEKGLGLELKPTQAQNDDDSDKDDSFDIPEYTPATEIPPTTPQRPSTRTDPILTRSQTKRQQLVFNRETQTFQHPSPDEAIEALRRRTKKKILHRKIQDQPGFILVEDVYYQVHNLDIRPPTPEIPQDTEEVTRTIETPIKEEPKEITHTPTATQEETITVYRPKTPPPPKPTFAKELLESTTKFLRPKSKRRSVDRPLRGTTKSYAQMLDEMLGQEPEITQEDIKDPSLLPDTTIPKMEPTEETPEDQIVPPQLQDIPNDDPPVAAATRSHQPKLEPGIP